VERGILGFQTFHADLQTLPFFDVDSRQDVLEGCSMEQITDFLLRQSLLYEQAEEDGIAHLPQALEHVCLELCVLDNVLQLVVEELQDPWGMKADG